MAVPRVGGRRQTPPGSPQLATAAHGIRRPGRPAWGGQPARSLLELIQFPRSLGVMNPSPFRMKVEVFLQLAGLPCQVNDHTPPTRLPKGKLPALRDGDRLVCNSQAIIEHLQHRHGDPLVAAPVGR